MALLAFEIKEFQPFSLEPAEPYYTVLAFICWIENTCSQFLHIIVFLTQSWSTDKKVAAINITSLNKTDTQYFLKKCFLYSQDNSRFHKCLTKSSDAFIELFMIMVQGSTWMEKYSIPPEYFVLNSYSVFSPHSYHRVTDW